MELAYLITSGHANRPMVKDALLMALSWSNLDGHVDQFIMN